MRASPRRGPSWILLAMRVHVAVAVVVLGGFGGIGGGCSSEAGRAANDPPRAPSQTGRAAAGSARDSGAVSGSDPWARTTTRADEPPVAAPKLAAVLGRPLAQVEAALGPAVADPQPIGEDTRRYRVGSFELLVTYRDRQALDVVVGGAGGRTASASEIRRWLGLSGATLSAGGHRFAIVEAEQIVAIHDTALPNRRIDIKRALGKRRAAVRGLLGLPETELVDTDVFKPWAPDDRIAVLVHYSVEDRAAWVQVSFDDGPLPAGRPSLSECSAQLAWLGLPVDEDIVVAGKHYALTVTGGSIELRER